jgi:hypothetical protein
MGLSTVRKPRSSRPASSAAAARRSRQGAVRVGGGGAVGTRVRPGHAGVAIVDSSGHEVAVGRAGVGHREPPA